MMRWGELFLSLVFVGVRLRALYRQTVLVMYSSFFFGLLKRNRNKDDRDFDHDDPGKNSASTKKASSQSGRPPTRVKVL
jgi:hypothetical protein